MGAVAAMVKIPKNVSSASLSLLPLTKTVIVPVVCPVAIVSFPDFAAYSQVATVVLLEAVQFSDAAKALAAVGLMVMSAVVVQVLPSVGVVLLMVGGGWASSLGMVTTP